MNKDLQNDRDKSESSAGEDRSWSALITLWIAAAILGLVTSILVWAFIKGFGLINHLTLGTFGALPAPVGQIATALIPAIGGLVVALFMHALSRPDKLAAMAHLIDGVAARGGRLNYFNGIVFIAGILATFFAQLAAIFFALEVVLGGFGGALFAVPTLIAVAVSALVTFWLGGAPVQYAIPVGALQWNWTLLLQIVAALLAALAAIIYVNLLPQMKKFWLTVKMPFWAKTTLAGLIVGIVGIWLPDIFGTGLSQMKTIFSGNIYPFSMLIALIIAKIILTPNSLGAGFVGGVIGPALLIGSALGAAYGQIAARLIPGISLSPVAFAMIATAAMLAGTFHAPLFGAMMIFEMSGNYELLLPLLFAAAIGYGVAKPFLLGSAYTFAFQPMGVRFIPGTFQEQHDMQKDE